jgi:hypothetical protein
MSNQKKNRRHILSLWFPYTVRILSLVFALVLPAIAWGQFTFTTNNGAITITGYTGSGGAVIIPATTNGLPVTAIGSAAFDASFSITSVTIPDSVTNIGNAVFYHCPALAAVTLGNSIATIGDSAFYGCGLTNIAIPNSVTSIGNGAFEFCSSLANVSLGDGLTNIGQYAFLQCTALTNITVDSSNLAYSSAAGALFDKSQDTLLQYPVGLTNSSYTISCANDQFMRLI